MKKNFTQTFALIVAIIAIIIIVLEVINIIHMMGITSQEGGFFVAWKADAPWKFVAIIRPWWEWILGIFSIIFISCCWEKKSNDE